MTIAELLLSRGTSNAVSFWRATIQRLNSTTTLQLLCLLLLMNKLKMSFKRWLAEEQCADGTIWYVCFNDRTFLLVHHDVLN